MKKTTKKTQDTASVEVEFKHSFPLVSCFTIKATIPTGQYANIQPEMVLNDLSFEDIDNIVMPKIELMFEKYLNFNDRIGEQQKINNAPVVPEPSQAYQTAYNALISAKNPEAKTAIREQIKVSKKLKPEEIIKLLALE
jgi:hypothetical protein